MVFFEKVWQQEAGSSSVPNDPLHVLLMPLGGKRVLLPITDDPKPSTFGTYLEIKHVSASTCVGLLAVPNSCQLTDQWWP